MARVGISRTPVKMDTAASNFMAGVAQVQAMTQAQEAHEQQLQKNEQAMRLADAQEERLERQDARQEQEASRNQIAFDAQVSAGSSRVRTWNGRDKPSWASANLNSRYDDLNDLARRIQRGRQRGDDMSADVLAFTQLAGEYDTLYGQESAQRTLTNDIGELEGLYEMTGLQPDAEVAGFIESVQSNVGGVGYTSTQATPQQRQALSQELGRARQYAEEYQVRVNLKSDIDAMREFLTALRAGRVPEGSTISPDVVEELAQMRLGDNTEDAPLRSSTLTELVELLDATGGNVLNPWDPEQDVSMLQDKVRQATGLFEILGTKDGKKQHDIALGVRARMEKEKRLFTQRNQVASMVQSMRREQPDGPMSPIERWAARHMENAGSGQFDLTYDDDAEYLRMWKAISEKAALLGGDTQMAIVAMNQAWRDAAPVRQKWDQMERSGDSDVTDTPYSDEYYQGYVDDVLASEQQLESTYSSADPRVDAVVNYTPEKTPAEFFKANDSIAPLYLTQEETMNTKDLSDRQIRMLSDTVHDPGWYFDDEAAAEEKAAYFADKRLSIALKQAGISRADYFGYEFKRMGSAEQDLFVNDRAKYGAELPEFQMFEATRTTFAEFAKVEPEKARKLLHAMQNPDPAWQKAWGERDTMGMRSGMRTNMIGWGKRRIPTERRRRNLPPPPDPNRPVAEPRADLVFPEVQKPREDMVFPELPPETTMLEDVYQGGQVGTQQRDFPGRQPVSPEEALGETPPSMSEQYADAMRVQEDRMRFSGDLPQDPELTRPLSYDDDSDRPNPRTPSYDMEGLDDLEGERAGVADVQETYSELSRTRVNDVKEDPIYKTAAKHAKTKRLEEVERLLDQLQQRRSKSGDGKLTRKDAAMFAALIDRRRKLSKTRRRR